MEKKKMPNSSTAYQLGLPVGETTSRVSVRPKSKVEEGLGAELTLDLLLSPTWLFGIMAYPLPGASTDTCASVSTGKSDGIVPITGVSAAPRLPLMLFDAAHPRMRRLLMKKQPVR